MDEEYYNDDEWEYYEEEIQRWHLEQSQRRFDNLPSICRKCRWIEWYYLENCVYQLPIPWRTNQCRFYSKNLPRFHKRILYPLLDLQWRWWKLKNRKHLDWRKGIAYPKLESQ